MLTLIATALGAIIAMLAQIIQERLRARAENRREEDESKAAVRLIRFHFFAAQQVLKVSLETHHWWPEAARLDLAAAGEDLNKLASRLPEKEWRIYTAAWRRLQGCIWRSNAIKAELVASGDSMSSQLIDQQNLQYLLATFVTVDEARWLLQPFCKDSATQTIQLGQINLTIQEISAALDQAGHLVDRKKWQELLKVPSSDPTELRAIE